ncbi:glycine C-acetyltransferase [Candidatus Protochlamydia phocaeensis]|uniref:glycine C-acetyltransferase n=1 Tax=Candidatus Protochlamydia phocaeensis TaxID=1414722 RepID=UPI0008389E75|nr:glycine C-acetyltransferase [Candidatus Protochlamydia phocaeensis]
MDNTFLQFMEDQLADLKKQGLYKQEREITSPQDASITIAGGKKVLNFCSNNYLGLANHPDIIHSAIKSYEHYGFGLSSVRFICGTQTVHKQLEKSLSRFLGTEETILYCSCFDANGGLFETILGPEDAVISDALNHASIIDGIRLCKAKRLRYDHNDMKSLEAQLQEAKDARFRLIATDGVFSMDGTIANLKAICDLADQYNALVMVDDCHAVGFLGDKGRGTPEYCEVLGRVDIITGTLGKALGGALGGYTSGRKPIIDWLRQRSRPYLFSNTLAPSIAAASLKVLELIEGSDDRRQRLQENSRYFRDRMTQLGFNLVPGNHPIIPVMLGDAKLAQEFAARMLDEGVYVIGFSYPVVPQGKARIRTQMCANHSREDLDKAIQAFEKVGKDLKVIP